MLAGMSDNIILIVCNSHIMVVGIYGSKPTEPIFGLGHKKILFEVSTLL